MAQKQWKRIEWAGDLLRTQRTRRGYSQTDMVDKLERLGIEISQPTYSNWENKDIEPKGMNLQQALASILRCDITAFFRRVRSGA